MNFRNFHFGCLLALTLALGCDDPETGGGNTPSQGELCHLNGAEVGIVGDSYIDPLFSQFLPELQKLAQANGALAASDRYVSKAAGGASMVGGGISALIAAPIPTQLARVIQESRQRGAQGVRFMIATGGGNDVLVDNRQCLEFQSISAVTQQCKDVIQKALDAGQHLFEQAAREGVSEAIYFFYPHLPTASLLGGPTANTILDYAYPLVKGLCERQTAIKCHFVDLRAAFQASGLPDAQLFQFDGVHPAVGGAKVMAQAVWKVMEDNCLASN